MKETDPPRLVIIGVLLLAISAFALAIVVGVRCSYEYAEPQIEFLTPRIIQVTVRGLDNAPLFPKINYEKCFGKAIKELSEEYEIKNIERNTQGLLLIVEPKWR